MPKVFIYSASTDFGGEFNPGQFFHEVEKSAISKKCFNATLSDDTIKVDFDDNLTSGDETILSNLITNHTVRNFYESTPFAFQPVVVNTSSWKTVLSFFIDGTNNGQILQEIKLYTKMASNNSNYQTRIFDVTNQKTLAQDTFTNTAFTSYSQTSFSNHPTEEAIIEIQLKSGTNKKKCYLNACKITF